MNKSFEIITKKVLLEDFLTVSEYRLRHTLFRGGKSRELRRLRLEKGHAVSVLLYDPDTGSVVMVEQFRVGAMEDKAGSWLLENPAGYVETGEAVEAVAIREVKEETGCDISELIPICEFLVSPGITNEKIILFCARVDSTSASGVHGMDQEGEDIRVEVLTLQQARDEMYTGRINSTSTLIAMQWLLLNQSSVDQRWQA